MDKLKNNYPLEPLSLNSKFEIFLRIGKKSVNSFFNRDILYGLTIAIGNVWVIGMLEAFYLTNKNHRHFNFIFQYGKQNILPSIIWGSKPAELIAESLGHDPAVILRKFTDEPLFNKKGAKLRLRIHMLFCLRSVIAGFMGIAQIMSLVSKISDANKEYSDAVSRGREPFLINEKPGERFIRLAGEKSDVTELSMTIDGDRIIPIIETPEAWPDLGEFCEYGYRPAYWHIPTGCYGKKYFWKGFEIHPSWMVTTANKKRILILEGDASVGEQSLALGFSDLVDLDIQEVTQGFRSLERILRKNPSVTSEDKVVGVLLVDCSRKLKTGGGYEYSIFEALDNQENVNIVIDARMPLIQGVVKWAEQNLNGSSRDIVFDTNNSEYFVTVQSILKDYDLNVIDLGLENKNYFDTPRLVYQQTTADTVNSIRNLVVKKRVDPAKCCAVLDNHEGKLEIQEISKEVKYSVESICSAEIYDDIFREVRALIKNDYKPSEIQEILNKRYLSKQ